MIFGPPNQEPRLEDLSLLLHYRNPQISSAPMTLKPACQSAPTTFTAHPTTLQGHTYDLLTRMSGAHLRPTTLQGHTYDPQTRMSGAHLRPSQLYLRPFKVTPTTLKPHVRKPRRPFSHFGRIQRYYPKRVEGGRAE